MARLRYPQMERCILIEIRLPLASYLERATERNLVILLMTANPGYAAVTPSGGIRPVYTTNPIAVGIPTETQPILIDISTSTTSQARVGRAYSCGEKLPGPWLVGRDGHATNDPATLFNEHPGAILPLGGIDLGYKGFALALLVEALSVALSGYGRADQPAEETWGIFLQLLNPAAFGGRTEFLRETNWLAELCRMCPVSSGADPVRLPGDRALERRRAQQAAGVVIDDRVIEELTAWGRKLRIPTPQPLK